MHRLFFLRSVNDISVRGNLSRIMVGLPSAENRESILKTLLAKEKHENIDFKELSIMTKGYSGSDLKVHFVSHSFYL